VRRRVYFIPILIDRNFVKPKYTQGPQKIFRGKECGATETLIEECEREFQVGYGLPVNSDCPKDNSTTGLLILQNSFKLDAITRTDSSVEYRFGHFRQNRFTNESFGF